MLEAIGIDGNWIDITSFVVAVLYAITKAYRRNPKNIVSKSTSLDLANGTSIFPLLLLGLTLFSSKLLNQLLGSNKVILSVAGMCALLAMLEDDFK